MEVSAAKNPKFDQILIYARIAAFLCNVDGTSHKWHSKQFEGSFCASIAAFLVCVFIRMGRGARFIATTPR